MARKHDLQFEEFASDALAGSDLDYVEVPISSRVFFLVATLSFIVIAVALGRIVYLNISRGDFYEARALSNVNLEKAIPAHRGIITDRNGMVIAKNTETFSVFINLSDLLKDRQQFNIVIEKLSQALEIAPEELETTIMNADFENKTGVPVVRNITAEAAIAVRGLALPSVSVENDFRREYPEGPAFSSVVGYTGLSETGNSIVGKAGLERYYDNELKGVDGVYLYTRDVSGNVLDQRVSLESQPGEKIVTTIDGQLQQYAYTRLKQGLTNLGIKGGVFLALEPSTGEILSLVSLPSYDNNIFMTPGKSAERLEVVNDSSRPLFNRAINGSYNPGSTIKPMVALSALHENVVTPAYQIYSKGQIEVPNPFFPDQPSIFKDWKAHGWVDLRKSLAVSSNVYYYEVGGGFEGLKGLGIERLHHYWEKFGFGAKTGVDANSENIGFLPDPEEKEQRTNQPWRIGDTYNVSIGQGDFSVSPLQLIDYIASIANNGVMKRPHLARQIGEGVPTTPVTMIDYSDWKYELTNVQQGMRDGVVKDYGTSHALSDLPMSVAAKTGSAQIQNNTKTNAFFVGYAPFEAPKIAVVVLIENAREGSLNAVPIAEDILRWYYENRLSPDAVASL